MTQSAATKSSLPYAPEMIQHEDDTETVDLSNLIPGDPVIVRTALEDASVGDQISVLFDGLEVANMTVTDADYGNYDIPVPLSAVRLGTFSVTCRVEHTTSPATSVTFVRTAALSTQATSHHGGFYGRYNPGLIDAWVMAEGGRIGRDQPPLLYALDTMGALNLTLKLRRQGANAADGIADIGYDGHAWSWHPHADSVELARGDELTLHLDGSQPHALSFDLTL